MLEKKIEIIKGEQSGNYSNNNPIKRTKSYKLAYVGKSIKSMLDFPNSFNSFLDSLRFYCFKSSLLNPYSPEMDELSAKVIRS